MTNNIFKRCIFILSILISPVAFGENEVIHINRTPKGTPTVVSDLEEVVESQKPYNSARYRYFLAEITDVNASMRPKRFFDYINAQIEEDFEQDKVNLLSIVMQMHNLEKSPAERGAIKSIRDFLDVNYKNGIIPAKAYLENAHIPPPFYLSDLERMAFDAIDEGNLFALKALVENYNLLKSKNAKGYSLLTYSIAMHRDDILNYLMHQGADLSYKTSKGISALHIAVIYNNHFAFKLLKKQGCSMSMKDKDGRTVRDYIVAYNRNSWV